MRTTTVLRRGALFVALVLLAGSLACLIPNMQVDSYDDIKRRFGSKDGVVFPDLAPLNLDESTVKYQISCKDPSQPRSPLTNYSVSGFGTLEGYRVYYSLGCYDGIYMCANITDPLMYGDTQMVRRTSDNANSYSENYYVYVNGFEYSLCTFFDVGKTLNEAELESLRAMINDKIYSFSAA